MSGLGDIKHNNNGDLLNCSIFDDWFAVAAGMQNLMQPKEQEKKFMDYTSQKHMQLLATGNLQIFQQQANSPGKIFLFHILFILF